MGELTTLLHHNDKFIALEKLQPSNFSYLQNNVDGHHLVEMWPRGRTSADVGKEHYWFEHWYYFVAFVSILLKFLLKNIGPMIWSFKITGIFITISTILSICTSVLEKSTFVTKKIWTGTVRICRNFFWHYLTKFKFSVRMSFDHIMNYFILYEWNLLTFIFSVFKFQPLQTTENTYSVY